MPTHPQYKALNTSNYPCNIALRPSHHYSAHMRDPRLRRISGVYIKSLSKGLQAISPALLKQSENGEHYERIGTKGLRNWVGFERFE